VTIGPVAVMERLAEALADYTQLEGASSA
jgi:hypothetical protein